jgi:hypothetical protein
VPQTICTREENAMSMNKPHLAFHRLDLAQGWMTPEGFPPGIKQKIRTSAIEERRKMGSHSWRRRCEPVLTRPPHLALHCEEVNLQ